MRLNDIPKYHYGKQLYKRNTGWYDKASNDDPLVDTHVPFWDLQNPVVIVLALMFVLLFSPLGAFGILLGIILLVGFIFLVMWIHGKIQDRRNEKANREFEAELAWQRNHPEEAAKITDQITRDAFNTTLK